MSLDKMMVEASSLDGIRKHQLMPDTVAKKIPGPYTQENVKDPIVWVKLFSPYSQAYWFITEYDPKTQQGFGWAEMFPGGGELGWIDIADLSAAANRRGLPLVERELRWTPVPLSKAKADILAQRGG